MVDPRGMAAAARPIAKALERGRELRIYDDRGTDLTVGLARRPATLNVGQVSAQGMKSRFRMLTNLPAGFVGVALDEAVGEGTFVSNRSCYLDAARVTDVRMELHGGRLVSRSFGSGGEFFEESYRKGGKGRNQPGQLRIGLNPMLHDTPQLEDSEAGAVTFSVGMNQFYSGGKNRSPYFGIAVNAGVTVEVDGKPLKLPS